jgi:predicted nucleotidyltransferase
MNSTKKQIIKKASDYLATQTDVIFAYLFGSTAKNNVSAMSDIDIAIFPAHQMLKADSRLEMTYALSKALETDKLDLVFIDTAPISLAFRVLQNNVLLLDRDPTRRHLFESLIMRKYFDFSQLETRILERRFANG